MWGRRQFGLVFVILWIAIICYVTINHTALIASQLFITTSDSEKRDKCDDPLHWSSSCDLRVHYLKELQAHRVRVYEEHNITTQNPIKMLFYTHDHYYQRFMDRWWFFRYDAAKRNPFVIAELWGPGLGTYNDTETLRENIIREYGRSDYFHIINVFLWQAKFLPELVEMSNESNVMEIHDEAWCVSGDDCKSRNSFPVIINASLIGFGYASELLKAEWQEIGLRRHLFHIPKTVCAERFYKPPSLLPSSSHLSSTPKTLEEVVATYDKERDIDVLLIGAMHHTIYPVRWRITCMYKSGYFKDLPYHIYHLLHPGYKDRTTDPFNATMAVDQIEHFAALMRRAKIVVTDSSKYHYAIGKYTEIPAAGALILGDIPDEREDEFNLYVARVHHRMEPREILDVIKYWLDNPVKRYQRAMLGQAITLQKYTNDHSVDVMIGAYLKLRQHRYGTHFPYPFADTCKATSPMHFSRYCETDDQEGNQHLDKEHGWYLPPLNCSLQFN